MWSRRALIAWVVLASTSFANDDGRFVGDWKGDLVVGSTTIPFVLHLVAGPNDTLTASLDSPAEKLKGLPAASVATTADGQVTVDLKVVAATYSAKLTEDRQKLEGTWTQRGVSLPLHFERADPETFEKVDGQERFVGIFEGKVDVGAAKLTLVFHISEEATGRLTGTLDSPDQGATGLLLGSVEVTPEGGFEISVTGAGATFSGRIDASGTTLDGTWKQGPASLPLVAQRVAQVTKRNRPQTPQPPFPYRTEDVEYENEAAGISLAGTLSLPAGDGPFPCAILITGSGPQDRDETIFEHKPFFVIADALTRRGIAVLRSDDRGVGGSTGSMAKATSEDFAGDVAAAMDFVASRPDIDKSRIGLIGHSEGGLIAPMVAAGRSDVAFAVLIAGPGMDGEQILYAQSALIARAEGQAEADIEANTKLQKLIFPIAKDLSLSPEECLARMREVVEAEFGSANAALAAAASEEVAQMSSPWMRYFLTYDPLPALRALRCPTLAVFGEKDLQVPAEPNAEAMLEAFSDAKSSGAILEVEIRQDLNHLFQRCSTGAVSEYVEIETTFDPAALERIVDFVVTHSKARD